MLLAAPRILRSEKPAELPERTPLNIAMGVVPSAVFGRGRDNMMFMERDFVAHAVAAAGTLVMAMTLTLGAARAQDRAQDKTYVMKFTMPTLNDPSHQFAKNYAAALERDSGGRIKTEIYPLSQLGSIPRQIEGTQFGAIQCAVIPPEFFVGVDERFEVMAAPGLADSMEHAQRLAADPAVLKLMLGLGAEAPWRRAVHERSLLFDRKITDPPPRRLQGQEDSRLFISIPNV
jgi:hypothetical protein